MYVSLLIVTMITKVVTGIPTLQDLTIEQNKKDYVQISREVWKARSPIEITALKTPVSFVVIHHSFIPPICEDEKECAYAMRTMQSMHMDERKWADIGYNFAVGGDGNVYEGRGWKRLGAHSLYFNTDSIGICLIGNFNGSLPPMKMLESTKQLIQDGVRQGFLKEDHKIIGHRQVRPTECPGNALFTEIQSWPHYDGTDRTDNYYKRHRLERNLASDRLNNSRT